MFKYFPIFYYPEGDYGDNEQGGGQEQGEQSEDQQEKTQSGSGESGSGADAAVDYNTDTRIVGDTPDPQGDVVAGSGEEYLKVQPYTGKPSQHSRLMQFGAPPPQGLPKHIQLTAGPYAPSLQSIGSTGCTLRIYVNAFVTAEDFNTGSLTIDSAFDSVASIDDITPVNSGAPYWTSQGNNEIIDLNKGLGGSNTVYLGMQSGSELYDASAPASKQFYLEYENNSGALPYWPFRRLIEVTWASGDRRQFQVLLPGSDHLNAYSTINPSSGLTFTNTHRADGCLGDGTTGHTHTSISQNIVSQPGGSTGISGSGGFGSRSDWERSGFFKVVQNNSIGLPSGYHNQTYTTNIGQPNFPYFTDLSFDSNVDFGFGNAGNQEENFSGEQYYKGIIVNYDGAYQIGSFTNSDEYWAANIGGQNPYDYAVVGFEGTPFGGYPDGFGTDNGKIFADVHVYSENTPSCTAVPPVVSFNACLDPQSTAWFQLTGTDCDSNNLLAFGSPAINYVANPSLAQWNLGSCCPDCNGLTIQATVKDVTVLGGDDGVIEVTVLDGGFSGATPSGNGYGIGGLGTATGTETGLGRYAWTIQALNNQTIGGLGASATAGNTLGYGYATHPSGIGQNVNTFTFGFQQDLAQDGVTTPQTAAFTALGALTVTLGSVTQTLIPAQTHGVGGSFSTGLVAGCYRIYVRDESVNASGVVTPCYDFIDVCVQDGLGVAGCTDNDAATNDGVALNYNSNAVIDDGSCLYCNANNGTLIDAQSNLNASAGEIAVTGVNSFVATPTLRTTSTDGAVTLQNIPATGQFQQFINDVVDANGMNNADYTIQFYKTTNKIDWDNAQTSLTPNDLTNFSTVGNLINNGQGQWNGTFNTTSVGGNLTYGYYAVKLAISDPDATVEIEQCYSVFYFVIPINVCVHTSGNYATAITNTNSPPGTLIIPVAEDILWWSNPSYCTILNNFCCAQPTLTNPSQQCATNTLVADFYCDPVPDLLTFTLEHADWLGTITTINTNTYTPTNSATYQFTWTQGSSITGNTFVDPGFYRVVLTSSYSNSADCTQTSAQVQISNPTFGCTDSTALNYDPTAVCDDGSCVFCIYGCTDSTMTNYDPLATCDDGSCTPFIYGCTDPLALNYDPNANTDDGSCIYGVYGCTDPTAYNYNKNCSGATVTATVDDGCCFYPCSPAIQPPPSTFVTTNATGNCGGSNADGSITVTTFFTQGAMSGQSKTISYYTNAGVLVYADPTVHSNATSPNHQNTFTYNQFTSGVYYFVITDNYGCQETVSFSIGSTAVNCGCTDPNASNYDPTATIDDGSCLYPGCIDPNALNYDPNASTDDGSCLYPTVVNPCIPANTNSLISLLQACIAKNGFQYYNKLVTGQADDCSIMNAWKVILIEYLVSKRGTKCIYNCADSATPNASTIGTCASLWTTGGPVTGLNDQGHAGSTRATGQGTTITDPTLYFVASNTLYLGDVIKMPSGLIYQVVPPTTSIVATFANPETAQGAKSGVWQQCVPGLQITSFPDSVNYLDKFNTFVAEFCVDCNIVDEKVIKNVKSLPPSRRGRTNTSIDGIDGLQI